MNGFIATISLALYYGFARFLPSSASRPFGKCSKWIRYQLVKRIFRKCGRNVNVERMAHFGNGRQIEIGDNSGIGIRACIPNNTVIGRDVMMGPDCFILDRNHSFDRTDIPMNKQGYTSREKIRTVIGDDVWIGMNVTMTPGRKIAEGTVIGACCLLCKDFPPYSIVGGNPARLIRSRK